MAFSQRTQSSFSSPSFREKRSGRTVGRQYQSIVIMLLLSLSMIGGIGSRLAYLQIVQGERNRELAEDNRVLLLPRRPARGTIFDRNGEVLVGSRLSHSVSIWPISLPKEEAAKQAVIDRLGQLLDVPIEEISDRLEQSSYNLNKSVPIARGLSSAQTTALAEYAAQLPGVRVEAEAVRNYPRGDLAAHVLGYTGELDDVELEGLKEDGYRLGDVIGKMGLEMALESQLRGEWGGQQVEVDSSGRVLSIIGEKPSISGQDVQTTLDIELQRAAEEALGDHIGAIVAIDPRDGGVRAMVSRPTFDPNIFSTRVTQAQWEQITKNGYPLVNRAMRAYAPASTFKVITATAGMESGKFSPDVVLPTYPFLTIGGIQFWDWNNAGFGPLGFRGAMAMSSDTFFYQIGRGVGEKSLQKWMRQYGLGERTGIELGVEEDKGLVPDEAWKREMLDEPWYLGDTINSSIGQGNVLATPLQIAVMFAAVANGGDRVTPHFVLDERTPQEWRTSVGMKPSTIKVLKESLRQVVTAGTGTVMNDPALPPVAGKSGTAEAPPGENHTWFGAYAPYDNPEIVVVAFGEHSGGGGSSFAAPMVKKVLEQYFGVNQKESSKTAP
ncbi:Penicillin-binding Protein dimerisation domain family [Synechococcus sp. PCC 7335]|uniref:penicillin-binding protein 2 n=1 Tax=Synechococcus sp. (strain ATCC 29403 / PCC 7335) TaxID=91464 RepID=UPI00017EB526|nr:penicillin-binding protein 2 [Synechococcus sp. PCC 7335]EDX83834.1 Penicillin-binding Protein dimerisation domain family [Synechococcus sp. PCC 7335]